MRGQVLRTRESETIGAIEIWWFDAWKFEDSLKHIRYGLRMEDGLWDIIVDINDKREFQSEKKNIWWVSEDKKQMKSIVRGAFNSIVEDVEEWQKSLKR